MHSHILLAQFFTHTHIPLMNKQLTLNHPAIWILVVVYQLVSVLWYTIFNDVWMQLNGFTESDFTETSPIPFVVAIVAAAGLYYAMGIIFVRMGIDNPRDGALTAALCWLGFLFLQVLTQNLFTFRPWQLALVDEGATFVSFVVGGVLLGAWHKYRKA
ncbi:MAG: hypothetical protein OHK0039_47130 [Bacteroidia bacterium]